MLLRAGFNAESMGKKLQSRKAYVKRSAVLVFLVLFSLSCDLAAQRGGRRGGAGGTGGRPSGTGSTDSSSLKDFDHAVAVQATDEQSAFFSTWAKSVESAQKLTTELTTKDAKAITSQISTLKDAVDEEQSAKERFLRRFSDGQKSGLKEFTKKLEKADSFVLKALKTLDEQSGRQDNNNTQIRSSAERLGQALTNLQSEQRKLGEEMGISSTPSKTASN
jgi:hypothetical protein